MEEEIAILVQYGGEWDSEHNFNNFVVDGITLKVGSNLDTILDEITRILGVYATIDTIEIKYSVKHNYTPMKIYNDRSLKWYLDLKSKSSFTDFPLCITLKENDCDGIMSNSNPINSSSTSTQDMQLVDCVEGSESIFNATSIVYPGVPHCVCLYHLWGNVKKNFRKNHKLLRNIFFAMATVYTTEEFDQYVAETYKIDKRVKKYLFDIGYHRWSIPHSRVNRFMVMTSNIAESVNAADKDARDLPIYDLLDYLMKMVGRWNNTNRNEAIATGTTLSTKYENLMREKMKESQIMTVTPSTEYLYTVYDGRKRYVVNMRERICTCRRFQIDVMPCKHALAIVRKYYMNEYEYCLVYYKKDYLLNTYEVPVYPIPDISTWEIPPNVLADV